MRGSRAIVRLPAPLPPGVAPPPLVVWCLSAPARIACVLYRVGRGRLLARTLSRDRRGVDGPFGVHLAEHRARRPGAGRPSSCDVMLLLSPPWRGRTCCDLDATSFELRRNLRPRRVRRALVLAITRDLF